MVMEGLARIQDAREDLGWTLDVETWAQSAGLGKLV